jgi:hypothetical protein
MVLSRRDDFLSQISLVLNCPENPGSGQSVSPGAAEATISLGTATSPISTFCTGGSLSCAPTEYFSAVDGH